MYYLTYYAFESNGFTEYAAPRMTTLEADTDFEAILAARHFIQHKAYYMKVLEDTFKIEDDEHTIVEFWSGKIVK